MGGAVVIAGNDLFPFIAAQLDGAAGDRLMVNGLGWLDIRVAKTGAASKGIS